MDKFQDKYRIESNRLYGYDYSGKGVYFITVVIENRACILGAIENKNMVLSDFGVIVKKAWLASFNIRNELFLDEYVIMPNHLHGLVILNPEGNVVFSEGKHIEKVRESISWQSNPVPVKFKRKQKSISSFIAGFKSATTLAIDNFIDHKGLEVPKFNRNNKFWQANYHDRIVRNEIEYVKIKYYIRSNPKNWEEDDFYSI